LLAVVAVAFKTLLVVAVQVDTVHRLLVKLLVVEHRLSLN
jgi:hypothetical protein